MSLKAILAMTALLSLVAVLTWKGLEFSDARYRAVQQKQLDQAETAQCREMVKCEHRSNWDSYCRPLVEACADSLKGLQ